MDDMVTVRMRPMGKKDVGRVLAIDAVSFSVPFSATELERNIAVEGAIGVVAQSKEEVVGYYLMEVAEKDGETWGNIGSIAVDAWLRREGIGTAMLSYAKTVALAREFSGLQVLVSDRLLVAHKFLKANGFVATEVLSGPDPTEDYYRMRWVTKKEVENERYGFH